MSRTKPAMAIATEALLGQRTQQPQCSCVAPLLKAAFPSFGIAYRPIAAAWSAILTFDTQGGDIHLEFLPPYAPELNPVKYLWALSLFINDQ
jgi:hypothetical protein